MSHDVVIESFRAEFRAPLIAAIVVLGCRVYVNEEGVLRPLGPDLPSYDIKQALWVLDHLPFAVATSLSLEDANDAKRKLEEGFLGLGKKWRMPKMGEKCCTVSVRASKP